MRSKKDTWSKFIEWTNSHDGSRFLFRGQADASPIIPKIARTGYSYSRATEIDMFKAFCRMARPHLKYGVTSDFEWLALAQHHGAPTRLTDWSTSPLIAAWFAVNSYPKNSDAVIYALDLGRKDILWIDAASGKASDGRPIDDPLSPNAGFYLLETSPVSTRITTQRGLFVVHGHPPTPLAIPPGNALTIPQSDRDMLQDKLLAFGIEASHIFPDLDGLCQSLDWRMRTNKPFGLV